MGGLLGGGKVKTPEPPPTPKPVRMPVVTDPNISAAKKRNQPASQNKRGRLSTLLTDQYQNDKLGS